MKIEKLKGKDNLYFSFIENGKLVRRSAGTADPVKAQEVAARAILGIGKRSMPKLFKDWEDSLRGNYKSERSVQGMTESVRKFLNHYGGWHGPECLTKENINEWVNSPKRPWKFNTRALALSHIKRFCSWLHSQKVININESIDVSIQVAQLKHEQLEQREPMPFKAYEYNRLVGYTASLEDKFWNYAVRLSRWGGFRMSDIILMDWKSFSTKGKLVVWTDKTRTRVEFSLNDHPELESVVRDIQKSPYVLECDKLMKKVSISEVRADPGRTEDYVFPERAKEFLEGKRSKFSVYFKRVLLECDLAEHVFHDLRATFATECYKKGVSYPTIAGHLGHSIKSRKVTEGYVK